MFICFIFEPCLVTEIVIQIPEILKDKQHIYRVVKVLNIQDCE